MRRSPLKIVFCTLLLLGLAGFLWILGTLLHDALPSNQKKDAVISTDSSIYERGPFTFERVNEDVGKTLYTYFKVYSRGGENGSKELVYVCGRRYESLLVKSMGWATDGSYDIIVQMKDGTTDLYAFDDNAGWQ